MTTIHLHEIIVFAHHGIHEEEKISGNNFEVNLDVSFESEENNFGSIQDTVDYEVLNNIVNEYMGIPTPLLENVCLAIINKVKSRYSFVISAEISIFKLRPPMKDFKGKAGVSMHKKW